MIDAPPYDKDNFLYFVLLVALQSQRSSKGQRWSLFWPTGIVEQGVNSAVGIKQEQSLFH